MAIDFDAEVNQIIGKLVDLDGFPPQHPWQCHDLWLWLLYKLGGQPGEGYAPGNGDTVNVLTSFPYKPRLAELFTKHDGAAGIRKGDILFWRRGVWFPGSHVALAEGAVFGELVPTITQNPGPVKRANLITRDLVGYLRPRASIGGGAASTNGTTMSFESIRHPNGTTIFADEYGVEGIDAYRSSDIGATEYLEAFAKAWPGTKQVTAREFDIIRAIADRRRAVVEKRIADRVVAQLGGTNAAAVEKAIGDVLAKQGLKIDAAALAKDVAKLVNDDAARRMQS